MAVYLIYFLILNAYFGVVFSASCETDDCYNKYKNLIENERNSIKDKLADALLKALNDTKNTKQLDEKVQDIINLQKMVDYCKKELVNTKLLDKVEEIFNDAKTNLKVQPITDFSKDVDKIVRDLNNWELLINKPVEENVTNLPLSISTDLDMLERLLNHSTTNPDSCSSLNLDRLFEKQAKLLQKLQVNITEILNVVTSNELANKNKKNRDEIKLLSKRIDELLDRERRLWEKFEEIPKQNQNFSGMDNYMNDILLKIQELKNKLCTPNATYEIDEEVDNTEE